MQRRTRIASALAATLLAGGLAIAPAAHAHGSNVAFGVSIAGPGYAVSAGAPAYAAPYYAPAPVYSAPAVVYPAPAYA